MAAGALTVGGWEIAAAAAKWSMHVATMTATGGAMFVAMFAGGIAAVERRVIARRIRVLCAIALLVSIARIGVLAGGLDGDLAAMLDPGLLTLVLANGEGLALMLRSAGIAAAFAALTRRGRSARFLAVGAVALVAISYTQVGHVLDATPRMGAQILLAAHVFGLCYWLGALQPLLLCCRSSEASAAASLLHDFGQLALYLVLALVSAGVCLLLVLLPEMTASLETAYVRVLLAKLVMACALLGLGAVNKLLLVPRLARGDATARLALKRSIGAEMVLAALILLAATLMTTIASPAMAADSTAS